MAERKPVKMDEDKFAKNSQNINNSNLKSDRDVIYVDTDDDITSVIEKVKKSQSSSIALIPPARAGVLQSVVNLKLLQRAAKTSRKQLSLVTLDKALVSLASGLEIPVAKSLGAQASIPVSRNDILENSDDNEIDGKDLAIGELDDLATSGSNVANSKETAAVAAIENDDEIRGDEEDLRPNEDEPKRISHPKPAKNKKIPNFNTFRKKLLIIGGIVVVILALIIAFFAIPASGTITITAKTSASDISATLSLQPDSNTSVSDSIIQPVIKTLKKTETADFSATGTKQINGASATGTVTITIPSSVLVSNNTYISLAADGLASGSGLTLGNQTYTTTSSASFSLSGGNEIASDVPIAATAQGSSYNTSNGGGALTGYKSVSVSGSASGGVDPTSQTIVQQADVDAASSKIQSQDDQNQIKSQLESELGSGVTPITSSFAVSYGTVNSNPTVGSSVSNGTTPNASMTVTYMMIGIANSDLNSFLNSQALSNSSNQSGQKVYDNGFKKVKFSNFTTSGSNYSVTVSTTAQVGPTIDENQVKQESVGKQAGVITSNIGSISGVQNVKVSFAPFWVSSVSNVNNLTVKFSVSQ